VSGDPAFLTVEDVLDLHEQQLARYGGAAGVRDPAALEGQVFPLSVGMENGKT
jgi:death-on-curing protein